MTHKLKRCPNGYRRNKTKRCVSTGSKKLEKCPPGSRKYTKRQNRCFTPDGVELFRGQNTAFIKLANDHIMSVPLEHVRTKVWLQKEGCNIFLIGETHNKRNNKCKGIYEMFVGLITAIIKSKIKKVDIMIQVNEDKLNMYSTTAFNLKNTYHDPDYLQLNNVRELLVKCIHQKCPFKVHSTEFTPDTWIKDLDTDMDIPVSSEALTPNLVRDIKKAQSVNTLFTVEFAKKMLDTMDPSIGMHDVYTVSKIISNQMKSVIIYESHAHINNLLAIFKELGYTVKNQVQNNRCL
jgi:hypothetical protein